MNYPKTSGLSWKSSRAGNPNDKIQNLNKAQNPKSKKSSAKVLTLGFWVLDFSTLSSLTAFTTFLILAAVLGLLAGRLKLPLILAYILTGVLAGQLLISGQDLATWEFFGQLGIAFLLFLVGLEMNVTELKEVGRTSLITGLGQVLITFTLGFLLSFFIFHFSLLISAYLAIGLSFSSTIIVIKLLSEKGDLGSLYGRISVGFLLVQDLIAILALIFLASLSARGRVGEIGGAGVVGLTFVKGLLFLLIAYIVSRTLIRFLFGQLAKSSELLLLGSIGWALLWAVFSEKLGLSLEIGAFVGGLTLAASVYHLEIAAKVRPLRDFFIIIFFLSLGFSMVFRDFSSFLPAILVFSVLVLAGNPLILLIVLGKILGYRRRTAFLAGLTVSQISEFSLIVAAVGLRLGHIDQEIMGVLTVVAVITITISSYLIQEGDVLYRRLSGPLKVFERGNGSRRLSGAVGRSDVIARLKNHVVLFGAHRMGREFIKEFGRLGAPMVVVDFDPVVVKGLRGGRAGSSVLLAPKPLGDAFSKNAVDDAEGTPKGGSRVAALARRAPKIPGNLRVKESAAVQGFRGKAPSDLGACDRTGSDSPRGEKDLAAGRPAAERFARNVKRSRLFPARGGGRHLDKNSLGVVTRSQRFGSGRPDNRGVRLSPSNHQLLVPIFGDLADHELLAELNLKKAKLFISTVPELETNLLALAEIRRIRPKLPVIMTAMFDWQAEQLRAAGADYVILPQHLAGHTAAKIVSQHWQDLKSLRKSR